MITDLEGSLLNIQAASHPGGLYSIERNNNVTFTNMIMIIIPQCLVLSFSSERLNQIPGQIQGLFFCLFGFLFSFLFFWGGKRGKGLLFITKL